MLKYPETNHSASNPFLGRYAYLVLPIGKTLDWNFIHNYSKAPGTKNFNSPYRDEFSRDQGVGSWELNLAGLLANENINTNIYPPTGALSYNYVPLGSWNTGLSFYDASCFIGFRYVSNTTPLNYPLTLGFSVYTNSLFLPSTSIGNIDEYGAYPSMLYPFDFNQYNPRVVNPAGEPWPGSYNTNMFYDIQELFDSTKTGPYFGSNIIYWSSNPRRGTYSTYNHYTFQRLLSSIGTGSEPEYGVYVYGNTNVVTNVPYGFPGSAVLPPPSLLKTKVNLNYDNTAQIQTGPYEMTSSGPYGSYTPMSTNLQPWTPLGFFTNAADLLLRSQVFGYTNITFNTNAGIWVTNTMFATFGITNIPVYTNNAIGLCYNEQVHRMLQLAANIYAAAYPSNFNGVPQPPVFRPLFQISSAGARGSSNTGVMITGYALVTNNGYFQLCNGGNFPVFYDLTNGAARLVANPNFWGIPWIVGAVKGLPEFNQYNYTSQMTMDRKILFVRKSAGGIPDTNHPPFTNQFYEMTISNSVGMDVWNPYSYSFPSNSTSFHSIVAIASNYVTITLTNNVGPGQGRPYGYVTNIGIYQGPVNLNSNGYWPAITQGIAAHKFLLQSNFTSLPWSYYSEFFHSNYIYPFYGGLSVSNQFLRQDTNQTKYPTYNWSVSVTNRLVYILFDGAVGVGSGRVLDFVNLGPFGSVTNVSQALINKDSLDWSLGQATSQANSPLSAGAIYQILDPGGATTQYYNSLTGQSPNYPATVATFSPPAPPATVNRLNVTAGYCTDSNMWMTCDPLVHYTTGDLSCLGIPNRQLRPS